MIISVETEAYCFIPAHYKDRIETGIFQRSQAAEESMEKRLVQGACGEFRERKGKYLEFGWARRTM